MVSRKQEEPSNLLRDSQKLKQYFGTDGIRRIPNETLNKDLVSKIYKTVCEEGVLVRASGNNFIISPSLIITKEHVNKIVSALDKGFSII